MTDEATIKTAAVLVIGNEILSGRTQDTNLNYIAQRLTDLGVRLREARVVSDDTAAIIAALNALRGAYDYVFTTGGIGPTHDDITADAVAQAFGVSIGVRDDSRAILLAHYGDEHLNEARLRMARIPNGASLIANPVSAAPGFRIGNVFVMAGVPRIMQAMFEGVKDQIIGGPKLLSQAVSINLPEGAIADSLGRHQQIWLDIEMGSYPFVRNGVLGTVIVLRGVDATRLDAAAQDWADIVRGLGGEPQILPSMTP